MKKVIVAATAFAALTGWTHSAVAADKLKLELGGYTKWFVGGVWNSNTYQRSIGQSFNNADVKGDSDITFSGKSDLDNGLSVGVFTALRAGTNTGAYGFGDDGNNYIDQAFLWVSSGYGKVLMGVMPNGALDVQAPEAIGQWNNNGFLTGNTVIARPDGLVSRPDGKGNNGEVLGINGNAINSTMMLVGDSSGKQETLSYVTPTFHGFTASASYVPSSAKNVRGPSTTENTIHDMYAVGLNYTNTYGDLGIKASAGWMRATIGPSTNLGSGNPVSRDKGQRLQAFNVGLNLSYAGVTLGGSYRQNFHGERAGGMRVGNRLASLDGNAWDAGVIYETGPWAVGVSYYGSRIVGFSYGNPGDDETVTFVQGSGKYNLGPGVSVQGLVGYGEYKASTINSRRISSDQNKGWTAMTGVMVAF